jgi:hypothetical protein
VSVGPAGPACARRRQPASPPASPPTATTRQSTGPRYPPSYRIALHRFPPPRFRLHRLSAACPPACRRPCPLLFSLGREALTLPPWASRTSAQTSSAPAAAVSAPTPKHPHPRPHRPLTRLPGRSKDSIYDPVLADSEREAVADLLGFLENVPPQPPSAPCSLPSTPRSTLRAPRFTLPANAADPHSAPRPTSSRASPSTH